jgi:hypothetical protein
MNYACHMYLDYFYESNIICECMQQSWLRDTNLPKFFLILSLFCVQSISGPKKQFLHKMFRKNLYV